MTLWIVRIILATLFITITAVLIDSIIARLSPGARTSRRWIWVGAIAASIILPLASVWFTWGRPILSMLFRWGLTINTTAQVTMDENSGSLLGVVLPTSIEIPNISIGWLPSVLHNPAVSIGVAVVSVLGLLLFTAVHLWLRSRRAEWTRSQVDGVNVLIAPAIGPAVIGFRNPVIVLPSWVLGAPSETQRAILRHENAHIAAGDSRLLALSAFLLAIMPWNLALWWQYRRLRAAIETDCDARVLASGIDVREYGEMLLGVATRAIPVPMLSPAFCANRSLIEQRIRAMTRLTAHRSRVQVIVLSILAVLSTTAAVDASSRSIPTSTTKMRLIISGAALYDRVCDSATRTSTGLAIPGSPSHKDHYALRFNEPVVSAVETSYGGSGTSNTASPAGTLSKSSHGAAPAKTQPKIQRPADAQHRIAGAEVLRIVGQLTLTAPLTVASSFPRTAYVELATTNK